MKIKILKYDESRNDYLAQINNVDVRFDPFVSGILNGEDHNRTIIDELEGDELELDLLQSVSGAWLLTSDGEKVFKSIIESI